MHPKQKRETEKNKLHPGRYAFMMSGQATERLTTTETARGNEIYIHMVNAQYGLQYATWVIGGKNGKYFKYSLWSNISCYATVILELWSDSFLDKN